MTLLSDLTDVEPNELADRYEATYNLYRFLNAIIESSENLGKEGNTAVSVYHRRVNDMRDALGKAQKSQNEFSMEKYRGIHGDLPTLETASISIEERALLTEVGIIDWDEEPPLPVSDSGERLPLLVNSLGEAEEALYTLEKYKQYISNDSVKILHVADTHLGFSCRDDEETEGVDCMGAFREAGEIAVREEVDAVVHAGDVFDHDVGKEHIQAFEEVIEKLNKAGINFHFVLGNHSVRNPSYDGVNAVARLMSMQKKGKINLLSYEPTILGNGMVSLYGVSHVGLGVDDWDFMRNDWNYDNWDESWWEDPDLRFGDAPDTTHKVFSSHGNFEQDGKHMPAEEIVEKANVDFDSLLLGHMHEPEDGVGGYEDSHYAGSTQRLREDDFDPCVKLFEFHSDGSKTKKNEELATSGS